MVLWSIKIKRSYYCSQGSPRPAVLDDTLSIVPLPPEPHGHRNGSRSRCIFSVVDYMSSIIKAKQPCYGPLKIKPSYYCSLLCIGLVIIIWRPANSNECCFGYFCQQRASDCCSLQRGSRNKLIFSFTL